MRPMKRALALGVTGILLAACSHKDKDAPLAFVPADTPYVAANLDVLDDSTREALFAQANAQLPAQVAQMKAAADELKAKDPDAANLLRAFASEFDGKTIEQFAKNTGLDTKGYSAFYGLGLAPVARFQLSDPAAFDAFVGRLEAAYGKKLEVAKVGSTSYRRYVSKESGTELILAVSASRLSPRCCRPTFPTTCCERHWGWIARPRACRTTAAWPRWPRPRVTASRPSAWST